jgi:hypothetical protein
VIVAIDSASPLYYWLFMTDKYTEILQVRCDPGWLEILDDMRRKQPDFPSRAEMVRWIIVQPDLPSRSEYLEAVGCNGPVRRIIKKETQP